MVDDNFKDKVHHFLELWCSLYVQLLRSVPSNLSLLQFLELCTLNMCLYILHLRWGLIRSFRAWVGPKKSSMLYRVYLEVIIKTLANCGFWRACNLNQCRCHTIRAWFGPFGMGIPFPVPIRHPVFAKFKVSLSYPCFGMSVYVSYQILIEL